MGENYHYKESISWAKFKRVLRTPSNLCCIGQGLPGSLPWGVILTFFNDYLVQEQHRDVGIAASVRPLPAQRCCYLISACPWQILHQDAWLSWSDRIGRNPGAWGVQGRMLEVCRLEIYGLP